MFCENHQQVEAQQQLTKAQQANEAFSKAVKQALMTQLA
jgi:hypothetical protein